MKRTIALLGLMCILLCGCGAEEQPAQIAATTLPVYEFTSRLCEGTDIAVTRLVTESVSCLHDYSLNVRQVKAAESAELIVISGAGLEDFMEDLLAEKTAVDASHGIPLLESCHDHEHEHEDHHHHELDPHIWLLFNFEAFRNAQKTVFADYALYNYIAHFGTSAVFRTPDEKKISDSCEVARYMYEKLKNTG